MLVNRMVVRLLESPLHLLLPGSLIALRITGRRSGRVILVPVQFALDGATRIVVYPSGFEHKRWWRNLLSTSRVDVLRDGTWTPESGRVLNPTSVGYARARSAYERRWREVHVDSGAPLVTISWGSPAV